MRITSLGSRRTAVAAATTLSLAAASIAGIALAPMASAAAAPIVLSAISGPSGGTNALTATTTTNVFYSGLAVAFQYKATSSTVCSPAYTAAVTPATGVGKVDVVSPKILSTKKLAFTVPSTVSLTPAGSAATASWLVCVYSSTNTTTGLLTATAPYTVAAPPTVSAILPVTGPALGGGTVVLTGTAFTAATTAKIGGVPLTSVTYIDATHISGVVPPQAAGAAQAVTVANVGGTGNLSAAYTYTNGISVSPNTTPTATASTDVDILGVGFSSLTFAATDGTTPSSANAHVYLVAGAYNNADNSGVKTNPQIGECLNVLVIGDTELICTVNTAAAYGGSGSAIANGTYTLTVVGDGAIDATTSTSIVSSGSTFTVAPY